VTSESPHNGAANGVPHDGHAAMRFGPDERNAMRIYLQRCEVRLGTLHRVATALISGAGLMVLVPVFFKDVVSQLVALLLRSFTPMYLSQGPLLTYSIYAALLVVLYILVYIPLRALYLLFKDITDFYFGVHTPGFPEELPNPSFAFTGIAFSSDEPSVDKADSVRHEIMRYQYQQASMDFMVPFSAGKRAEYFNRYVNDPQLSAMLSARHPSALRQTGLIAHADNAVLDQHIQHFNAALGLMRSIERPLVEEVAKTEMSLVRHIMFLRRIVLRYIKTTLIFVWTLLVLLLIEAVIGANDGRLMLPPFAVLAAGCIVWSMPVTWIMHMPIEWIYRPITRAKDTTRTRRPVAETLKFIADFVIGPRIEQHIDAQLVVMERSVRRLRHVALILAVVVLILALYSGQ
jgi:hypothetical protein